MQKKMYFLYHDAWENNHAEPILRHKKQLGLECISCPSNPGRPELLWPKFDDRDRIKKINSKIDSIKNAKAILIHHRCITQEILQKNLPLIILEHTDGTSLEISRYLIGLPNVIGVIKGTKFTNLDDYNSPCREGMFQGIFLKNPNVSLKNPELKLTNDQIKKIELGYSFGCFPSNKRFLNYKIDFDKKRKIDISFVGEINYPRSRLITNHRKEAKKNIENIGGIYNNKISTEEFDQIMLNSKICLSPYGYGACYRSFESLYSGCLTIQPNSDWVESWPNVYVKNKTYFECKYDFSDLHSKTNYLLENYKNLKEIRIENRKTLIENYFGNNLLYHIMEIIEKCLKRI